MSIETAYAKVQAAREALDAALSEFLDELTGTAKFLNEARQNTPTPVAKPPRREKTTVPDRHCKVCQAVIPRRSPGGHLYSPSAYGNLEYCRREHATQARVAAKRAAKELEAQPEPQPERQRRSWGNDQPVTVDSVLAVLASSERPLTPREATLELAGRHNDHALDQVKSALRVLTTAGKASTIREAGGAVKYQAVV